MPLPERYRRLWRRRLRRRPLLPFLLLATVAVDLAMLFSSHTALDSPFLGGLLGGQIGLLAVWVTHQRRGFLARCFVSLALLLLAMEWAFGLPLERKGGIIAPNYPPDLDFRSGYLAAIAGMAGIAILTAMLIQWLSARWRQPQAMRPRVRLQISSLLWAMLIAAVLLSFGQYGAWASILNPGDVLFYTLLEAAPLAAMLVISLVVRTPAQRGLWLIGVPCVAVFIAMAFWSGGFFAYYTSYAAFLGGWLYLAGDRGPAPDPRPRREPIEAPPASIDLRA